ncbi:MAG: hypothetical protein IK008_03230 [Bacteroidales bacterium]|nr:hypothetical protein [Bacteroidales bacterium]
MSRNLTLCRAQEGWVSVQCLETALTRSLDVLTPPFMGVACDPAHNVVEQTPSCR